MSRVREMQGVPAQLEYLKSDGKRRHPAHCIFREGTGKSRICTNPLSKPITSTAIRQKTVITMRRAKHETANL